MVPSKPFQSQVQNMNRNVLQVMIYELLIGPKGKIQGAYYLATFLTIQAVVRSNVS
jgi:hypothetical protein